MKFHFFCRLFKGFTKLEEGEEAEDHQQVYRLDTHFGYVPVNKFQDPKYLEETDFVHKPFYGFVPYKEEDHEAEEGEEMPEVVLYRY